MSGIPYYDLENVASICRCGEYVGFSAAAERERAAVGMTFEQGIGVLLTLTEADFEKTHSYAYGFADSYLTVFRTMDRRLIRLYVKFQITATGRLAVLSFHARQY